eukprot:5534069-Pyramimonas_sp.AAC.1
MVAVQTYCTARPPCWETGPVPRGRHAWRSVECLRRHYVARSVLSIRTQLEEKGDRPVTHPLRADGPPSQREQWVGRRLRHNHLCRLAQGPAG